MVLAHPGNKFDGASFETIGHKSDYEATVHEKIVVDNENLNVVEATHCKESKRKDINTLSVNVLHGKNKIGFWAALIDSDAHKIGIGFVKMMLT